MTTPISDIANVIHHGGKHTVTGSCHELKLPHGSILIDCGLFQGKDIHFGNRRASLDIEFPVKHIQALVLTHAHIDHIGRLPWLLAAGCWLLDLKALYTAPKQQPNWYRSC